MSYWQEQIDAQIAEMVAQRESAYKSTTRRIEEYRRHGLRTLKRHSLMDEYREYYGYFDDFLQEKGITRAQYEAGEFEYSPVEPT